MNKVIVNFIMAFTAVLCSCSEPEAAPAQAIISAADVTVEEGQTAQIPAATNSTATISYTSADDAVATVSSTGQVTGIKAGSTTITLSVDAVEGLFTSAQTTVKVTVNKIVPVDDGKPKPGVYTFTVSPMKGEWEAGDQILVQGGYGPAAQVITLTAGQISADGKVAGVELGGDLFKYLTEPDPLYAVWPAGAVKKEDGLTGQIIEFEKYDIMLAQAYLEENNFAFKDITSFISFAVTGGYDRFIIAGKQRPGLLYTGSYKNEYSSAKITPSKPKDDGYPFREEDLAADGGPNTIYFPGGVTFKGGFTIFFATGDNWTASYTYAEDAILKTGNKLELGDITSKLVPYEGGRPHMPQMGNNTKYAVQFNELSGLCVNPGGDFLWCVGDGSEIAKISVSGELLGKTDIYTYDGDKQYAYTIDSEGISFNYDTGDLLIGGEPNVACRIPSADLDLLFTWSFYAVRAGSKTVNGDVDGYNNVQSLFNIADAKGFGNAGAEGCTYYKDNLVYIGTQSGSYLYLCDLSTGEVLWRKGLREKFSVITEIAGLCYDPLTDWLWVIDSESHKFFALSGDAEQLLGAYALKSRSNEESICVDHVNGCVWVGDDYGSTSYIYKYEMTDLEDFIINE